MINVLQILYATFLCTLTITNMATMRIFDTTYIWVSVIWSFKSFPRIVQPPCGRVVFIIFSSSFCFSGILSFPLHRSFPSVPRLFSWSFFSSSTFSPFSHFLYWSTQLSVYVWRGSSIIPEFRWQRLRKITSLSRESSQLSLVSSRLSLKCKSRALPLHQAFQLKSEEGISGRGWKLLCCTVSKTFSRVCHQIVT
jgi:hypothetical protein